MPDDSRNVPEATDALEITPSLKLPMSELEWTAIRAQGAGGQNVNKVSSAIHLRFDIKNSSLPERYRDGLLAMGDRRISKDGVVVPKAQRHRTQERNLVDALARLAELIRAAGHRQAPRKATRPSRGSVRRRLDAKSRKAKVKANRRSVRFDD